MIFWAVSHGYEDCSTVDFSYLGIYMVSGELGRSNYLATHHS